MEFNAKKFKVLMVTRIRSIDGRDYYLGGIKLDRVDVEKDLGVFISHNLNWNNLPARSKKKCLMSFTEHAGT